jgi:subfamily B ATP-binding cassette protein HlyB/CyaB
VIQDNMRFIAKGRTVIIIAHRLTAVRDAQSIIVMDQGEVAERGSHAELVDHPEGRYARLYALQAGRA